MKHRPTARTVRQGQTVYLVNLHLELPADSRYIDVERYFLYSHKEPLPGLGCRIIKMPVSRLREYLKNFGNDMFYYSKAKALRRAANET